MSATNDPDHASTPAATDPSPAGGPSEPATGADDDFAALLAASEAEQPAQTRVQTGDVVRRLRFRVTQISAGGRNVVVSRRHILEEEAAAQAATVWERLAVGAVVRGTVTSLRDFGAFVDLGGVEGLIHVTELGYGRPR